jgi:hypothetical protein
MSHLGDLASVLVDDELGSLDSESRERALAHLSTCSTCEADVDAQRHIKARMKLAAGVPAAPAGLLDSLLRIPEAAEPATPRTSVPGVSTRRPPLRSASGAPRGRIDATGPGRALRAATRGRYVAAAGLAASVVVGLGGGGSMIASGASGTSQQAPASPRPSVTTVEMVSTTFPADNRPIVRPHGKAALSVVYRRP